MEAMASIEDGTFAREWMEEADNGCPNLLAKREALADHPVEKVGVGIRSLFEHK